MPAPDPVAPASQTFEEAMERLETVVAEMENSKLPLEDLIRCYEEGTGLVKVCTERLAAAEQRIEIITREAAADAVPTPPAVPEPKPAPAPGRTTKKSHEVSLF